jgi:hypothetical protein
MYLQRFTGKGLVFHLVCGECRHAPEYGPGGLRSVCVECFARIQRDWSWEGIVGQPEVKSKPSRLSFRHEIVHLSRPLGSDILDVQPVQAVDRQLYVALTRSGSLFRLDLDEASSVDLCRLPEGVVNLEEPVALHLSGDGSMGVVVNSRGQRGVAIDLVDRQVKMRLTRDDYHNEHCPFPIAFCEDSGRLLLIHETEWNRLDISDPRTGELLTARQPTSYQQGEQRPEHYLDYFHGSLAVSPGGLWVADNGWVWHPVGIPKVWGMRPWLHGNVWESEDGPSCKALCHRVWHWHSPLCWVGQELLAVWGYGGDDDLLIPAVRIFDMADGKEVRWFAGPKGNLVFDEYLFSFDASDGTSVWDVNTGERLLHEPGTCPQQYHHGARSFLSLAGDGTFRVTKMRGRQIEREWLSRNEGTVARLARGILQERAFDGLPVLADALEEAGCTEEKILEHCRNSGPHTKACWVLDLLLVDE